MEAKKKNAGAEIKAKLAELVDIGSKMGAEELDWLLAQARILAAPRSEDPEEATIEGSDAGKKGKAKASSGTRKAFAIERNELVRSESGDTWHWLYGNTDKIFNSGEMNQLAKIAFKAKDETGAALGLWRWLDKERRDAVSDFGIDGISNPALLALTRALRVRMGK
jgi:hypothetical protein